MIRYRIDITGIVQGVGFRPFVYNLAKKLNLNGFVKNLGSNVLLEVEGDQKTLDQFVKDVIDNAPVLSNILSVDVDKIEYIGYKSFQILKSTENIHSNTYISADVSICPDCHKEMLDKNNRRYRYPFINCTNCGPRFTIIKSVPYDRVNTTMSEFKMCEDCQKEYGDPSNRRYHAQPISCFSCGPDLFILDRNENVVFSEIDPVETMKNLLIDGNILAIKGLGGYHLVCDGKNEAAVGNLRGRKIREDKPFALMAKDLDTIRRYCYINDKEKELLLSNKRPIVLLKKNKDILPKEIAPNNNYLGFMLPYNPVQVLLFDYEDIEVLVMTSGNISNEPIFFKDNEALKGLNKIADYFVVNNREIHIRTDDSVTRAFKNNEFIIRRSRGYVPVPINFKHNLKAEEIPSVLACGSEQKSTFCINNKSNMYISHHIGDLENIETFEAYTSGIDHFKAMLNVEPKVTACDLHYGYFSTQYAKSLFNTKRIMIQHHHAHIASCMVDNGINEKVIGVAFDGTGLGYDNKIWGGEFFTGDFTNFERRAHLNYVKLAGGDMSVKEPWRMGLSYIVNSKCKIDLKQSENGVYVNDKHIFPNISRKKINLVLDAMKKNINSPYTSSMGRFFDAVSAILNIRDVSNYEAQAAIELEFKFKSYSYGYYSYNIECKNNIYLIKTSRIIEEIFQDIEEKKGDGVISSKFHETIAQIVLDICIRIKQKEDIRKVVLSGGVFQNMVLLGRCIDLLDRNEFDVYTHKNIPTNDGGISIGQAAIAIMKYSKQSLT